VPVLLISAPVKLDALIASLNVTVKLIGTEFVVALCPAARTNEILDGAKLSLVKTTILVQDALLRASTARA
jgi:hypothetical protein